MSAFVRAFPLFITLGAGVALLYPPAFTWFLPYINPGLGVIMLGMGVTLTVDDFRRVATLRAPVLVGVLLQYTLMPLLGFAMGRACGLPTPFAVGLILVACCPGGTASNVVAYLAGADVALSVTMTAVSTLLAAFMTPLLSTLLIGDTVEVDPLAMLQTTAGVVLLPVVGGLFIRTQLPRLTAVILPVAPVAAVVAIVLIVSAILGLNRDALFDAGPSLVLAVLATHAAGFGLAFVLGGLLSRQPMFGTVARTVSIEVGMQNSGLGSVLARAHFANPLTAVPSALSAVFHCVLGSALAAWWARHPASDVSPDDAQRDSGTRLRA
ncbi:MAG: bile acid:sodium symporter family protein [Polyangiales bacterium]|nr:bile acid:sodium symporter family protein [Myxococcales bacterium]MCB9659985.1 bile acid:sodium symporter family protein [Sandaracinaceae bacterium]